MTADPVKSPPKKIPEKFPTSRLVVGILLSLLSGVLFFLAFPPLNIGLLMFVALVPYLVAQHRFLPLKLSPLAPTIALGIWLWPFLYRIFNIPGAPFLLLHMGVIFAVLIFFTSRERKFIELTGYRWFMLQGLFAWVGFEVIRSFVPLLGTMGFVANTLAGLPWLTQPVSIFSIYGLNLLVILVNFTLAYLILAWIDKRWHFADTVPVDTKAVRNWTIAGVIILAAWIGLSLFILNRPPDGDPVRVAALHMDLKDPGHQVDDQELARRLELLDDMVHDAAEQGAEIVYTPEMAFGFDPQQEHTAELQTLVREYGVYLYFTYAYHDDLGWHNETVLISPEGDFSPIYGKQHAFGEPPTISAGEEFVNQTPLGKLGAIICMDGVFTDSARGTARAGAQLLAIPSYDTTVGISEQNWTHFTMRSVENQVPVINADRGLYTMITDHHGRILADVRTPEGSNQVVIADVVPYNGKALYTSVGDWLGWVSLAGFIFFMVFQNVTEQKAKKAARK